MWIEPRKQLQLEMPEPQAVPQAPNEVWSMDLLSDQLSDGRSVCALDVPDDFVHEGLAIEVDLSLPSNRRALADPDHRLERHALTPWQQLRTCRQQISAMGRDRGFLDR